MDRSAARGRCRLLSRDDGEVEGYPEPADAVSTGFFYNGSLSTYDDLGFTWDRSIGKHR